MINGCLVIHGLTGTPGTVATLTDALLAAGYRVSAPCLAGHGWSVEELAKVSWQDWYETVRIAFQTLRKDVDKVYCAGISLGSLLAMKLALDEGWGVRALSLLATPLRFSVFERMLIPLVRYSPLRWMIIKVPKNFDMSVGDPEGRLLYQQLSLPAIPPSAVYEIAALQKVLEADLSKITNPILLMHGGKDRVAPLFNVNLVKQNVSSDIVETKIFPKSQHVITMDVEKDEVAKAAVDFFKRFA